MKQCCICGQEARGQQWHNRDRGFGICPDCAKEEQEKLEPEDMKSMYGIEGVHYKFF